MIGRAVAWRYSDEEGKPTRDLIGHVAAVALNGAKFMVLVETADGMDTAEAKDLVFTEDAPAQVASVSGGTASYDDAQRLAGVIIDLGVDDDNTMLDPCAQAGKLLQDAFRDLTEAVEQINNLTAERDAALLRASAAETAFRNKQREGLQP